MPAIIDYSHVFQTLPFPCAVLSSDWTVAGANPAFVRALGMGEDALTGHRLPQALRVPGASHGLPLRDALLATLLQVGEHRPPAAGQWSLGVLGPRQQAWSLMHLPVTSPDDASILHCLVPLSQADLAASILSSPAGQGHAPDASGATFPVGTSVILSVVDDAATQAHVRAYFDSQGLEVREASDVAQAIALLGDGRAIDLVFVDIQADASALADVAFSLDDDLDLLVAGAAASDNLSVASGTMLPRPYTLSDLGDRMHHLLRNREQRLLLRQATAPRAARDTYAPTGPAGAPSAESLRILLVEDSTETREATTELLELLGHMVTGVSSAEEALDILAGSAVFDILCSDMNLPDMSGAHLARVVREMHPGMGVVFASGARGLGKQSLGERTVALPKPYSLASLERALHQAMGT